MSTTTHAFTQAQTTAALSELTVRYDIHLALQTYTPPQETQTIPLHADANPQDMVDICAALHEAYLVRGFVLTYLTQATPHSLSIRPVTIEDVALMSATCATRNKFRQLFGEQATQVLRDQAYEALNGPAQQRRLAELAESPLSEISLRL